MIVRLNKVMEGCRVRRTDEGTGKMHVCYDASVFSFT